jgi:hypothetical protein
MTAIDPSLFDLAPPAQDLLDEARLGTGPFGTGPFGTGPLGSAAAAAGGTAGQPQETPSELGDDALVEFTAAAQNWFNTEQMNHVPRSIISVQQMLSTLVGSMTADATTAFATAAQMSPQAALALTRF